MSSKKTSRVFIFLLVTITLQISCIPDSKEHKKVLFDYSIEIQEEEKWWPGVIAESHRFPLDANSVFSFDFWANTAGNQGQPLLISNQGRYIWNEEPFKFEFNEGTIHLKSNIEDFAIGESGTTLKEAYQYASKTFFPASGSIPAEELFTHPQFNTWIEFTYYQNQAGILEYAKGIIESGFTPGVLMIDEGWAKHYGNWEFNELTFPDAKGMIQDLKKMGFKIMLWVCPYFSPDGVFWKEQWLDYKKKGETIWIVNADNPEFPAVMQWWDGFSNVIDLSNPSGYSWFTEQLDYLVYTYGIDGFKFDGGDAVHYSSERFLSNFSSYNKNISPNDHAELFNTLGLDYPLNEFRAGWKMGGEAVAMRLRDKAHNWEDLHKLIPGIINQGQMGYPYNCPDMIGGGEYLSFLNLDNIDQELVVRAAQCHALMPMMQFSAAPWRILSKENLQICVDMGDLHEEYSVKILELAYQAARTGEPIVRSMEYVHPGKGYSNIIDQFFLGDDILVAPVLEMGARKRKIVFPKGNWRGDDGSLVKGPTEISIDVPLERLPYFVRNLN